MLKYIQNWVPNDLIYEGITTLCGIGVLRNK